MGKRQRSVESLGVTLFADRYAGRRVVVTGHTGFKGSWLTSWLTVLGAKVTGIALDPETSLNHWDALSLDIDDRRCDIRDADSVASIFNEVRPEILFHLAAQPLVRHSYEAPLETWSTNVQGTAAVLDACRAVGGVEAIVVATTDKVYLNDGRTGRYSETDRLGGHDPYSASKAACELLVDSYRRAFFSGPHAPALASARAGNVIGGGDWAADRLIPDVVRAMRAGTPLALRSPDATRPWQHVLESLSGYLMLGQRLLEDRQVHAGAWNFGPSAADNLAVSKVMERMKAHWPSLDWCVATHQTHHEARLLDLDSSRASRLLGWRPIWNIDRTLAETARWYRAFLDDGTVLTHQQIVRYVTDAEATGARWAMG